jgi:hypothetical protein
MLDATSTLKLSSKVRKQLARSWANALPPDSQIFGYLIFKKNILYNYHPKKHDLSSKDKLLLINLVNSSETFKNVDSWIPACLPDYNDTGFLHCYSSYVMPDIWVMLISTDKNSFFDQRDFRNALSEQVQKNNLVRSALVDIVSNPISVMEFGIVGLRNCIFRFNANNTFYEPCSIPPYTENEEIKR